MVKTKYCEFCDKHINTNNFARHKRTRIHVLNEKLQKKSFVVKIKIDLK